MKQPSTVDDIECSVPFVPQPPVSPVDSPAQPPKPHGLPSVVDEFLYERGILPRPSNAIPETEFPPPATGSEGNAEIVQPRETLVAPVETPLPPPRKATAVKLIGWIKQIILAQMHLPDDAAEIVAFWVISTWFQDALSVLPCLVITGAPMRHGPFSTSFATCARGLCCWPTSGGATSACSTAFRPAWFGRHASTGGRPTY